MYDRTIAVLCQTLCLACLLAVSRPAYAQDTLFDTSHDPVTLTLDEAIQIALVNNYALQSMRMDGGAVRAQVRDTYSSLMPKVDASGGYTRNVKSANPFAGSQAGDFFSGFAFIGWLAYNEDARTDSDPTTIPIAFGEYDDRLRKGLESANISVGGNENPFAVANQFRSSINITQRIFNGAAVPGIKAVRRLERAFAKGLNRQEQVLTNQVRQAFYQTLLQQEQTNVTAQSVVRATRTLQEVARRVAQGVAPKYQRLSAEVVLANLESRLVEHQNQTAEALGNLKYLVGIPVEQTVNLRGALEVEENAPYMMISAQDAVAAAFERRPDLEQARLTRQMNQLLLKIQKASFLPNVAAFANFTYTGSVPDDRSFSITDENDPFTFTTGYNDFFSTAYWQPAINVGFNLTWTIFDGFHTSSIVQQQKVEVTKSDLEIKRLAQAVRLEVETALRNLNGARQLIASQKKNVANAELSYSYAKSRLAEGVATPLEERNASDQLDQSRINYLQAVYSYLVAQSAFEIAIGIPLGDHTSMQLTHNQPLPPSNSSTRK